MEIKTKLQMLYNALPGKGKINIGVWGDSLLQGVVLDDVVGRYRILKDNAIVLCSQVLKATVENFSNFGCTVIKGKQRLIAQLDKGRTCDVAILEFGGNDCDMPWKEISAQPELDYEPKVPLRTFSTLIQDMINTLVLHGIVPLLTTLPPLNHERYLNWICRNGLNRKNILKFLGDSHYIYRHHERYSLEISKLAMENDCMVVDFRSAFLDYGKFQELLCIDGIHPNDKGQMLIRETFLSFADKFIPSIRQLSVNS